MSRYTGRMDITASQTHIQLCSLRRCASTVIGGAWLGFVVPFCFGDHGERGAVEGLQELGRRCGALCGLLAQDALQMSSLRKMVCTRIAAAVSLPASMFCAPSKWLFIA